ncbi:MAG TPA: hypothetical protein VGI57_05940, partial [Usitatibacter sp.]
ALNAIGLSAEVSHVRAGIVACTGNTGCKFSASDTKRHALAIADHLDDRVKLDAPINIHLTGCPHSCAQHYIGDVGLLATKITQADDRQVEGYHVYLGGGFGERKALAREVLRDVPAEELPATLERVLKGYLAQRAGSESFQDFARRHSEEALRALASEALEKAA